MVTELGRARAELQEWSRTLEARVETKTRELEEAHKGMLVVEKMASLGKLAAVVAHEINNPLAGIGTYARLLRKRAGEGGPNADVLKMMEEEALRCGNIVRNLLLFSRNSGARFCANALAPLVERSVMLVRHQADLQGVAIEVGVPPDLPLLVCDAGQVQQVLVALALNAIEAMPKGGTLGIRARALEGRIVLEVEDTGCGIPAEHQPHVFEPFYTTKEEGKGVGLGLAVVYGIVERHHGRIRFASAEGRGTTFTIELPLEQPSGTEVPS
jgi:two-component system NtrC family sensor kinase